MSSDLHSALTHNAASLFSNSDQSRDEGLLFLFRLNIGTNPASGACFLDFN